MTHTAAQITAAQQAGNKAWARAYGLGKDPEQCADAYREALEAEYASTTPAGWFVNPAVTLDELADGIIAEMEARTAETAAEAPDYPGMWK
jgi:hypothetical protein